MQTNRLKSHKNIRAGSVVLVLAMLAGTRPAAAEDTAKRIGKAIAVLDKLTDSSGHGIQAEKIASADCIAVIPGFKKAAAIFGVSFGRGFISCRNGDSWSAPGAVALEGGSLGIQIGGEEIDIVILSLNKEQRSKLLSDRFTIGSDASAAWGNGKSAHDDPNATILFFGHTKGVFAGFDLDGTTLKPDDSGVRALYGKTIPNDRIVEGAATPVEAQALVSKLTSLIHPQAATLTASHPTP